MSSLLKSNPTTPSDDLVERGRNTYKQKLASILEPSHLGEFVAVEPDSAQYFLGNTTSAALVAARAAMPNNLFYLNWSRERSLEPNPNPPDELSVMRGVCRLDPLCRRQCEGDWIDVESNERMSRIPKHRIANVHAQHHLL